MLNKTQVDLGSPVLQASLLNIVSCSDIVVYSPSLVFLFVCPLTYYKIISRSSANLTSSLDSYFANAFFQPEVQIQITT